MKNLQIRIKDGKIRFIYDDMLTNSFQKYGEQNIKRASHVEPGNNGKWYADLSPVNGPNLGPFNLRQDALDAEVNWLIENKIPEFK